LSLDIMQKYPFVDQSWSERLARAYGTRVWQVLGAAKKIDDLGEMFGATLSETEVVYLIEHEWANTVDDIVWRRSKLGLRLNSYEKARLGGWMRTYRQNKLGAAE